MANLKVVSTQKLDTQKFFSALYQLKERFRQSGLPTSQASLLAMHLAEIDEESVKFRKLVSDIRKGKREGRNGYSDDLLEQLVDIELSVEHMKSHIDAMSKIPSETIDVLDQEEE